MRILYLMTIIKVAACYQGSVQVVGQFICNGEPWKNEMVSIYEANYVFPDTLMSQNRTDQDGNFTIDAFGEDNYPLRPYVYLPNYCNAEEFLDKQWATYLRIKIPDFYVDSTRRFSKFKMDLGTMELSQVMSEQIGFQKFTDLIKNFAESRWIVRKKM